MLTCGLCACGSVSLDLFLMASSLVAYGQHLICACGSVNLDLFLCFLWLHLWWLMVNTLFYSYVTVMMLLVVFLTAVLRT